VKPLASTPVSDRTAAPRATGGPTLLMVAGEPSGDMQGAALIRAMRDLQPDLEVFGIGGAAMRAEGMDTLYDARDMAVMGFFEVLRRFLFFRRAFLRTLELARARQPYAMAPIDSPGFNLRLARRARALGLRTVYYICPQVWAWHRSRIPRMAAVLDRLITIFPFEAEHFQGSGLTVDFVGHPLTDEISTFLALPPQVLPWSGTPRIALLPGSRSAEIRYMLPTLWQAAGRLQQTKPDASFLIPAPSREMADLARAVIARTRSGPTKGHIVCGQAREVLRQADAAIVASGTATLEAALLECPMILLYKMAAPTYFAAKRLIRTDHIGIASLVADRRICPEFLQDAAHPAALAQALLPLIEESPQRATMLADFLQVKERLGTGGAARRAAALILETAGCRP
jgi:lipid-A-disaccharide synthase